MVCANAYVNLLPWAMVPSHVEKPMLVGGPVHTYRTRSQVE